MELQNDIQNYQNLTIKERIYLTAFLVAVSGIMSVADSFIPKPLPFAKIGIANCVTLILIIFGQYKLSLKIAILRTLVSALMVGTILSYTFLFSLSGAFFSTLAMIFFHHYFKGVFSIVGISIIGAFFSTVGQSLFVILLFGADKGMVFLASLFAAISIPSGVVIGFIGKAVIKRLGLPKE